MFGQFVCDGEVSNKNDFFFMTGTMTMGKVEEKTIYLDQGMQHQWLLSVTFKVLSGSGM